MGQKSALQYAIVDLETTGGKPDRDKITEIGIVLHNGREIIDTYSTLINPGVAIPPFITRITGISQEMVDDAPRFHEVAKDIILRLEHAVFVAHNARFDYHFLREAYLDLGYAFHRPFLCTVRMSRKAFPGLPSYSLENLIRHFEIPVKSRHRALDDALATAKVLQHILEAGELTDHQAVATVSGIRKERSMPAHLPPDLLEKIPVGCGVYYFLNDAGEVIYVGKSVHMRKRLAEHLREISRKAERLDREIASVEWEETGSELYASLLESYEIKRLQPSVNKAQRGRFTDIVLVQEMAPEGYLRLRIQKDNGSGDVVNRYTSMRSAQSALAMAAKRFGLCRHYTMEYQPGRSCFEFHVGECQGACTGREAPESYNERALLAATDIARDLQGSFYLVDDGPEEGVQAVFAITDGLFTGMGFLSWDCGHGVSTLEASIKPYPDNPEARRIIRQFMTKKRMARIERNLAEGMDQALAISPRSTSNSAISER